MATMTQVCNSVSVRLDETNYPSWLYLMHHHIRGHGLLKFIDGSHPCPSQFRIADDGSITPDNSKAYEQWVQQDSILISMITNTLSADALTLVIGCETSLMVWSALKQHYAPQSEFHIMRLKSALHNIRKASSDSIDKYLLRFKVVQNQLDVVGNRMSDVDMITLILAGLPGEYAHTRQIIRSKNSIDMEEVRCLLLAAEFEIELKNKAYWLSSFTAMSAPCGSVCPASQIVQLSMPCVSQNQGLYNCGYMNGNHVSSCMPIYAAAQNQSMYNPSGYMLNNSLGIGKYFSNAGAYCYAPQISKSMNQNGGSQNGGFSYDQSTMLPSIGNYQSLASMGSNGCMINDNMTNDGSYDSVPSHTQQQQVPTVNRHRVSQIIQSGYQDYQHNGYSNSFSHGGNTEDNISNANFFNKVAYYNSNYDQTEPRNDKLVCQICEQPGHNASKCCYRTCSEASTYIVECQICKRSGHSAKSCNHGQSQLISEENDNTILVSGCHDNAGVSNKSRHLYGTQPQSCAAPKALSATIFTHPEPPLVTTQSDINASRLQVKPLQADPAPSLSSPIQSPLQQSLKKLVTLPTSNTRLHSNTHDRSQMNCKQACESTNLWRLLPLIPPG